MNKFIFAVIICIVLTSIAMADGPPHKGNRYTGGEMIIINLTDEQKRILDDPKVEFGFLLKLTKEQRKIIRAKWGVAPSKLEIWETRKGLWDCSCMSANLGFRFSKDQLEVPREYLMSDKAAKKVRAAE
mgnify:CR=1 FL=1